MKVKSLKLLSCIFAAIVLAFTALLCNLNFSYASAEQTSVIVQAEQKVWTKDEVNSVEKLRQVPTEQIMSWDSYDSRDYDIVTSVKNQGDYGLCWVYGPLAAMETSILREGIDYPSDGNDPYLSQFALAKATMGWFDDPLDLCDVDNVNHKKALSRSDYDHGGNIFTAVMAAARWYGICNYTDLVNLQDADGIALERYSPVKLESAQTCSNIETEIKELIATYGSVAFAYNAAMGGGAQYYYTSSNVPNHVSAIVGWDDGITAETFRQNGYSAVTRDGAWIVKNSWGPSVHNQGYYYLSYQSYITNITAFDMMPEEEYDYCYNYAGNEPSVYLAQYQYIPATYYSSFMAVYEGLKGGNGKVESLKGISVGIANKYVNAEIRIYTDVDKDNLDTFDPNSIEPEVTIQKSFKYEGIYTVELPKQVEIDPGSYYLIYIKLANGGMIYEQGAASLSTNDLTFYRLSSGRWVNFSNYYSSVAAIKGLTVVEDDNKKSIDGCTIMLDKDTFIYSGVANTPKPTVKAGDIQLVEGVDYTVSYSQNVNVGQGVVIIKGQDAYRGTRYVYFAIDAADISSAVVTLSDNLIYNGQEQAPLKSVVLDGRLLDIGTDYSVTYSGNVNAGNGSVTIKGQGNYKGTLIKSFFISKAVRTITATMRGWTYGDEPNVPVIIWDSYEHGETVWYRAIGGEYTRAVPVNAGQYEVKIVVPETVNHHAWEIVIPFTIEKADSPVFDFQSSIQVDAADIAILDDIALPADWRWENGSITIADGMTATAVYVGADKNNYKNIRNEIYITVIGNPDLQPEPDEGDDGEDDPPVADPDDGKKPDAEPDTEPDTESDDESGDVDTDDGIDFGGKTDDNEQPTDDGNVAAAVALGVGASVACAGGIGVIIYAVIRRRRKL